MRVNNWNIRVYCQVGECGTDVIMSLLLRKVHPTTIYSDIKTNTPVNHNYLILKAIDRLMQGKGITHKYICNNSIDYVEHNDPCRHTICLENGNEWIIRKPSDYTEANKLEVFSKKLDQRNQELAAKHPI